MTRTRANFLLLTTAFIWGTAFVAQATGMKTLGPFGFVGLRFCIGALSILPFALFEVQRNPFRPDRRSIMLFLLTGGTLFIGSILQQAGLLSTSVTNAGFFTGLYVVIVPFLALPFFRRLPHPVVWPAALTCLVGTWAISGGDLSKLSGGDFLIIVGALFWALHLVAVGLASQHIQRPMLIAFCQFFVTGIAALLGAFLVGETIHLKAIEEAAFELAYTGILSTGIAFTLQIVAQRHTHPADAAIILSSEVLFAALAGAVLLSERLSLISWAGCALIFCAILAVELVPRLKGRQK